MMTKADKYLVNDINNILDNGYMDENYINKKSTNGTWLYAFEDVNIEEGMIFKSNHNLFICSFQ